MNPFFTFFLGLLVGWLIEWVIDYFYWRTRSAHNQTEVNLNKNSAAHTTPLQTFANGSSPKMILNDLKVIKGIGPVIEGKLNSAGIYTFEQLGNLTTTDLERILGDVIERLADEESLLEQARALASKK